MVMKDVVSSIIAQGGVAGVVVGLLWLAAWVYGKVKDVMHDHADLKRENGALTKTFSARCDKLEHDLYHIKEDVSYVKGMLNLIIDRSGKDDLLQAHSPLSLTEKGRKTAEEMGAERIIATNWESRILPKMNAELPGKNPYDIQQYCLERVPVAPESFFSAEDLDAIKLYAFRKGLPLFSCLKVVGVMIRDAYLRAKNIAVEDIDKHAPSGSLKV